MKDLFWKLRSWFLGLCVICGTELVFGDNIYEDMEEHWYCPNKQCPDSELYEGPVGSKDSGPFDPTSV